MLPLVGVGQNPYGLSFDGINDYVDLGEEVGNGVRTIEFWFKPLDDITPELEEAITVVARETTEQNVDEFNICFSPSSWPGNHGGRLRFTCTYSVGQSYSVSSDTVNWDKRKWYHIAAVIHPTEGLLLFVNGYLQNQTEPAFTTATATNGYITTLGCWGNSYNRFFTGSLDEVRFSSVVRYSSDFIPPCNEFANDISTIGLYHLNEGAGVTITDASSNFYDGTLHGAVYQNGFICENPMAIGQLEFFKLSIFPNPATATIRMQLPEGTQKANSTTIYDMQGRLVMQQPFTTDMDVSTLGRGTYAIVVQAEGGNCRRMIQKE